MAPNHSVLSLESHLARQISQRVEPSVRETTEKNTAHDVTQYRFCSSLHQDEINCFNILIYHLADWVMRTFQQIGREETGEKASGLATHPHCNIKEHCQHLSADIPFFIRNKLKLIKVNLNVIHIKWGEHSSFGRARSVPCFWHDWRTTFFNTRGCCRCNYMAGKGIWMLLSHLTSDSYWHWLV